MALITCPECHGQVSDKAAACPHCGYPINQRPVPADSTKSNVVCANDQQAQPDKSAEVRTAPRKIEYQRPQPRDLKQESKSSSGNGLIWSLIIGLTAVALVATIAVEKHPYASPSTDRKDGTSGKFSYSSNSSSGYSSSSSRKQDDDDDIKAGVYVLAKKCVKDHLKAPSTAKFSEMWECASQKGEGNIYMMTGYVDSQNSYGAMLQEQWSIMAEVNGDKASLVMLTIGDQVYFD